MESPSEYAWMLRGQCRASITRTFFPSDSGGVEVARRVCAVCPVNAECLEYALVNCIEDGVWGGTSQRERHRILRQRHSQSLQRPVS